ncbi:hypothetical protein ENSA5_47480 [Enhygromyxa salina]|uniref:Uncharacterized protein n=1 Tax=Enhygromyxa salina TaxID=215803 RepID=A0A2S9XIS2_9BACT|nr:fibrinogen-like YCDxxxxGGGW domain-containing protein [Enhygromyxa salina]PRP92778.1 hypothetical protein ENSA5_47480 [Enhygromyxa salina]
MSTGEVAGDASTQAQSGMGSGSDSDSGSEEGTDETSTEAGEELPVCGNGKVEEGEECDLGLLNSDNGGCTTACALAVCGDGLVYIGKEACDDGNTKEDDMCTTLCEAPGCDDGLLSGLESDVDCGGGCLPCGVGLNCEGPDDCETWGCFDGVCGYTQSCSEINAAVPEAPSGRYWIDVDGDGDGAPFEVLCELERSGGGWTLVLVSSDDGQDTWTYENRAWLATDPTIVGELDEVNRDYKSRAYNELVFRDILAVHAPSEVWAAYEDVSQGSTDLGHYVGAIPSPNCDYELAGNGVEMTDGTLESNLDEGVGLCDTDLYFNLGDHEVSVDYCLISAGHSNATYGLAWSKGENNGCPFDDANSAGLGPNSPCESCDSGTEKEEVNGRGFAHALGLNTGTAGAGENYMAIFVR